VASDRAREQTFQSGMFVRTIRCRRVRRFATPVEPVLSAFPIFLIS
jgi:hypothetical protein